MPNSETDTGITNKRPDNFAECCQGCMALNAAIMNAGNIAQNRVFDITCEVLEARRILGIKFGGPRINMQTELEHRRDRLPMQSQLTNRRLRANGSPLVQIMSVSTTEDVTANCLWMQHQSQEK